MVYMGSKNRIAKELLAMMLPYRKPGKWWVEPFVGGANVIDKVPGELRLGLDNNRYLIAMWNGLLSGTLMPKLNYLKEEYDYFKDNKDKHPAEAGVCGFCL